MQLAGGAVRHQNMPARAPAGPDRRDVRGAGSADYARAHRGDRPRPGRQVSRAAARPTRTRNTPGAWAYVFVSVFSIPSGSELPKSGPWARGSRGGNSHLEQ